MRQLRAACTLLRSIEHTKAQCHARRALLQHAQQLSRLIMRQLRIACTLLCFRAAYNSVAPRARSAPAACAAALSPHHAPAARRMHTLTLDRAYNSTAPRARSAPAACAAAPSPHHAPAARRMHTLMLQSSMQQRSTTRAERSCSMRSSSPASLCASRATHAHSCDTQMRAHTHAGTRGAGSKGLQLELDDLVTCTACKEH